MCFTDFRGSENQGMNKSSVHADITLCMSFRKATPSLFTGIFISTNFIVLISHPFQIITEIQNCLTPDKANIMLISKTLNNECTEKEKWFNTRYCVQGLLQSMASKMIKYCINGLKIIPNDFLHYRNWCKVERLCKKYV